MTSFRLSALAIGLFLLLTPLTASAQVTLAPLNGGEQMTCQFVNNSAYANNQVYILVLAGNSAGTPSYLNAAGAMVPVVAGQNCGSYSLTLAQILPSLRRAPVSHCDDFGPHLDLLRRPHEYAD